MVKLKCHVVSSSFNMDSGGEDTVKEKSRIKDVFNDEEKGTESIEIEKQLKKEIRDVYV